MQLKDKVAVIYGAGGVTGMLAGPVGNPTGSKNLDPQMTQMYADREHCGAWRLGICGQGGIFRANLLL